MDSWPLSFTTTIFSFLFLRALKANGTPSTLSLNFSLKKSLIHVQDGEGGQGHLESQLLPQARSALWRVPKVLLGELRRLEVLTWMDDSSGNAGLFAMKFRFTVHSVSSVHFKMLIAFALDWVSIFHGYFCGAITVQSVFSISIFFLFWHYSIPNRSRPTMLGLSRCSRSACPSAARPPCSWARTPWCARPSADTWTRTRPSRGSCRTSRGTSDSSSPRRTWWVSICEIVSFLHDLWTATCHATLCEL